MTQTMDARLALLEHIRAVGPITLYDILGWLGDQFNLPTNQQVGLVWQLHRDHKIQYYDKDDLSLGWVTT